MAEVRKLEEKYDKPGALIVKIYEAFPPKNKAHTLPKNKNILKMNIKDLKKVSFIKLFVNDFLLVRLQ